MRNFTAFVPMLLAATALAEPVAVELPISGLKPVLAATDGVAAWSAQASTDDAGPYDLLTRAGEDAPSLAVGVAPECASAVDRYLKRAGLMLVERPGWVPARFAARVAEDVAFPSGRTTVVACAQLQGRALLVAVARAGAGAPPADVTGVLDALVDAASTAGDGLVPSAAPDTAPPAALASLSSRIRYLTDPAAATAKAAPRTGTFALPAGSSIIVVLDGVLSSKTAKKGEAIPARVGEDVVVDDAVVIAKGAAVTGKVLEASSGGIGGSPGKIKWEFSATTAVDGQAVALDYRADKAGKSEGGYSFLTGINLTAGGQYEVAAGTPMEAKTKAALQVEVK